MSDVCPISFDTINEKVARVNAAVIVVLLAAFVTFSSNVIIVVITADFLVRALRKPQFSPVAIVSKNLLKMLKSKPKKTNAGPKIFAAKLGFLFSLISAVLAFSNLALPSQIVAGVLAVFAFMEAAFGFCLACKVYPLLLKFKSAH